MQISINKVNKLWQFYNVIIVSNIKNKATDTYENTNESQNNMLRDRTARLKKKCAYCMISFITEFYKMLTKLQQ